MQGKYSVEMIRNDIKKSNIIRKLDKNLNCDPNNTYKIFEHEITKIINKHITTKEIKFNKRKHKESKWITNGILKSITYRNKLYKNLLTTNRNEAQYLGLKINLQTYNKILSKTIRNAKKIILLYML